MNELEKNLLTSAENAVRAGGLILKQRRFKELRITGKEDGDIATSFDFETEAVIKAILRRDYPNYQIYAEESGIEGADSEIVWYLDSLDGVKAYLRGNISFVSMTLAALDKQGVLCGIIYNPFTDLLYSIARSSEIGFVNGQEIIQISRPPLDEARILLDFSNKLPLGLQKELVLAEVEGKIGRAFRYDGSIAQHLCLLAQSVLDGAIFWGTGRKGDYWDLAAAQLLCEKCNLKVVDFDGQSLSRSSRVFDQFLVGSEELLEEILAWIRTLRQKYKI